MFQKFYNDTLGGRFIKSLLAQTPLPMYESVIDGDHLVAGCYYVYKRFIIKCVYSGILKVNATDVLFPSNTLYPSEFLIVGVGYKVAKFYVISYVDDVSIKTHSVFKSTTNYYDSETHYILSKYLRYLYTTTGLNLFPYYNCYNSTYFSDVELCIEEGKIKAYRVNSSKYKVVGIPILFGKTYSIFVDCPTQVLVRACIHDNTGFVDESSLVNSEAQDNYSTSLLDTLENSGRLYSNLKFSDPITFRVETSSKSAVMLQHNMYLVIQLPLQNDSSIVVLENYNNTAGIRCYEDNSRKPSTSNLSLLKMNTRTSYAFSNRLLEYLLGGVIYNNELIPKNVANVQTALANIFPEYKHAFLSGRRKKGVWDSDIGNLIQTLIDSYGKTNIFYDQDGNINRDTELLLYSRGGKY